jgi:all-trans-retinol dehydrogenase (NAD+)
VDRGSGRPPSGAAPQRGRRVTFARQADRGKLVQTFRGEVMSQIDGRTILITGAASGLGRLMALKLARRGGRILAWDIHEANLMRLLEELGSISPGHRVYRCDVSSREDVRAVAARVKDEAGRVEILVNNAGVVSGKRLLEVSDEQIERTLAVNAAALFWTTRAFLPGMIEARRGHVVTVASAAGLVGVAGLADYCASKFAAVGFDEALRVELGRAAPGVRTTVVCPYFVDTGMFHGVRTRFSFLLPILKEEKVAERIVRAIEANRRRVLMPPLVYLVPLLRLLPLGAFDAIAGALGVNAAMDHFEGRTPGSGPGV